MLVSFVAPAQRPQPLRRQSRGAHTPIESIRMRSHSSNPLLLLTHVRRRRTSQVEARSALVVGRLAPKSKAAGENERGRARDGSLCTPPPRHRWAPTPRPGGARYGPCINYLGHPVIEWRGLDAATRPGSGLDLSARLGPAPAAAPPRRWRALLLRPAAAVGRRCDRPDAGGGRSGRHCDRPRQDSRLAALLRERGGVGSAASIDRDSIDPPAGLAWRVVLCVLCCVLVCSKLGPVVLPACHRRARAHMSPRTHLDRCTHPTTAAAAAGRNEGTGAAGAVVWRRLLSAERRETEGLAGRLRGETDDEDTAVIVASAPAVLAVACLTWTATTTTAQRQQQGQRRQRRR